MIDSSTMVAAQSALQEAGLLVDSIAFDGLLYRVPTIDKPNSKNGAYTAYADAPVSVWWQNWRTDETGVWVAKGQSKLTKADREELTRRKQAREGARKQEQQRAAEKAQFIYGKSVGCQDHPYLQKKGVKAVPGLKLYKKDSLVVPLYDEKNAIASLQFIKSDASKIFIKNGRKKGCFFPIGGKATDKPLLICEGLATGLSLHECIQYPVLVAFDAGNLLPVTQMARSLYPERVIILCADNDTNTDNNPGLTKATDAAQAIDGYVALPRYQGLPVDWNDLHCKMGAGEVRTQFMHHKKPEAKSEFPHGFSIRDKGVQPGLWHVEYKENDDPVETWIGPPLHILGATRDENSNSWGLLLEWSDPDNQKHIWAMPKSMLASSDSSVWRARLADEGWSGAPSTRARNLLALYLSTYKTDQRARCVSRTGWHKEAFVLPDTVILAGHAGRAGQLANTNGFKTSSKQEPCWTVLDKLDNERIVLQVQTPHNPFRTDGTLEGWQETVGQWARGNSRLILAICASLAAPLLELSGQDSGGFNWTGQSSTGKTTALIAAGSVWGKGSSSGGYVQNWRATSNGLEGLAALHSDAALCLDEIGQAPGRTIMEASYMLANGMGKSRAFQDGSVREAKSWRCMVLSTGEKGLEEKIAEEGGKAQAGQLVRLIDIPTDAGAGYGIFETLHGHTSPSLFSDAIKRAASTHYGHMARAFIQSLQNDRQTNQLNIHQALNSATELLCPSEGKAHGQVARVAKRFILCAVAGEMATEWGLLPWSKGEALEAIKTCFNAWLSLRGGIGATEDTAIIEQVTLFIEQHGASRFQDLDNPSATCINRVGFRQRTESGATFYILPESFKAEVCKGYSTKRAAAVLSDAGLLLPGDTRSFTRKPPCDLPDWGRKRCYTLIIGGHNELA